MDIKIFASNRIDLESKQINNSMIIPIRCGAVYDNRENISIAGDDTGDNISSRRNEYCELTVQYWAWKNVDADYYGLCHYRRFLIFPSTPLVSDPYGNVLLEKMDENSIKGPLSLVKTAVLCVFWFTPTVTTHTSRRPPPAPRR